jgi:hypothetical protein
MQICQVLEHHDFAARKMWQVVMFPFVQTMASHPTAFTPRSTRARATSGSGPASREGPCRSGAIPRVGLAGPEEHDVARPGSLHAVSQRSIELMP